MISVLSSGPINRALRLPRMDETLLSYTEDFHVNNERERGLYLLTY
jgi:hypothetical protein